MFDRGLLFGDGVFETLRAYGGVVFRLESHLDRLRLSLRAIEIDWPVDDASIQEGLDRLLEANRLLDARIRLTVTGGLFDGAIRLRRTHPPSVFATAVPTVVTPPEVRRRGIDLAISSFRQPWRSPLARVKTIHRLEYLLAREEALQAGAEDALILDDQGGIAECSASNIFLVHGDRLSTPSLESPILAGVTREAALDAARVCGLSPAERQIGLDELWTASEIFVTATSSEILGVRSIDGRPAGAGGPGPLTTTLYAALRALIEEETAGRRRVR